MKYHHSLRMPGAQDHVPRKIRGLDCIYISIAVAENSVVVTRAVPKVCRHGLFHFFLLCFSDKFDILQ